MVETSDCITLSARVWHGYIGGKVDGVGFCPWCGEGNGKPVSSMSLCQKKERVLEERKSNRSRIFMIELRAVDARDK